MFSRWLNGKSLSEISRAFGKNPAAVNRAIKKCVEKLDTFCYNKDRYLEVYGHLFEEMGKNVRRLYPKTCYDDTWGLTHREVRLFKLWKIDGYSTKVIAKRLGVKEHSVRQYKSTINRKADLDEFERRIASYTCNDFDLASTTELSGF